MDPESLISLFFLSGLLISIIALLIPVYLGILASLYLVYRPDGAEQNPVLDVKFHVEHVYHSYVKLLDYWLDYKGELDIQEFVAPLLAPPIVGAMVGMFLMRLVILYFINRFRIT